MTSMITKHANANTANAHMETRRDAAAEIGHGHYGVVRKCMDRETKVWYAIKSIRKSKVGKVDVLKREVALLKECDHPNIIQLVEVHEDKKYLHLVTELCTGGELFDRIIEKTQSEEGCFSERDAAGLVRCILDAIAYCHDQKGIVHRDVSLVGLCDLWLYFGGVSCSWLHDSDTSSVIPVSCKRRGVSSNIHIFGMSMHIFCQPLPVEAGEFPLQQPGGGCRDQDH